jgi:hypothetical protein
MPREYPYKYLNFKLLEAALKAKFGKITAYFDHVGRDGSWYYKAKRTGSFKVSDLEIACDVAGIKPIDVLSDTLIESGSKLEDAAIASRLAQLVQATTGNTLDFSLKSGILHSELKHILEKSGHLNISGLKRILVNFPLVNAIWLLHGNGAMFIDPDKISVMAQALKDKTEIIDLLRSKIENLEQK